MNNVLRHLTRRCSRPAAAGACGVAMQPRAARLLSGRGVRRAWLQQALVLSIGLAIAGCRADQLTALATIEPHVHADLVGTLEESSIVVVGEISGVTDNTAIDGGMGYEIQVAQLLKGTTPAVLCFRSPGRRPARLQMGERVFVCLYTWNSQLLSRFIASDYPRDGTIRGPLERYVAAAIAMLREPSS